MGVSVRQVVLNAEAGQISAELGRLGVAAAARVHVIVALSETAAPPRGHVIRTDGAFQWLDDEPDLYRDADLFAPRR